MRQGPVWLLLMVVTASGGCSSTSTRRTTLAAPVQVPPGEVDGVVFCADGAGGSGGTTKAFQDAVTQEGRRLRVEMVLWSHAFTPQSVTNTTSILRDHTDLCRIQEQGYDLARRIHTWRCSYPTKPVYLAGHSAGCAVVLDAAGRLPPGSVERIILMAPAVSVSYDLRPALAGTRGSIDAFISRRDWVALGIATRILGTTDRRWAPAAGRVGFQPILETMCDQVLYSKLRQHNWDECQAWTGNQGGHYGAYTPKFLHAYVMPLLTPAR